MSAHYVVLAKMTRHTLVPVFQTGTLWQEAIFSAPISLLLLT